MAIKFVGVKFQNSYNSTIYDFMTDLDLKEGDWVVCDTANGYQVAKVSVIRESSTKATKWIISTVDVDAHTKRLQREKELKALRTKMEKRVRELDDESFFRAYAAKDEAMATLFAQYEKVKAGN